MIRHIKLILFLFILFGCVFAPVVATVEKFAACEGHDESGYPIGVAKEFSIKTKRIYACGYLTTNHPIDIDIHWYHEQNLVFTQEITNAKGYFYAFVVPSNSESFIEGEYQINVLYNGVILENTDFQIISATN